MWFICDTAGLACVTITYLTVLIVQIGFFRIGVWEGLLEGDLSAYVHTVIFQYHVMLIYLSHIKCMTTEPGVLRTGYEELDLNKMSPTLISTVFAVKDELKRAINDGDDKEPEPVEAPQIDPAVMDKNLEESKQSWFYLLFGIVKQSKRSTDIKILREQRKRVLDAQEKKMKYENMILILSKFKIDSLKKRPEVEKHNIGMYASNIRFLSNLVTKSCRKCNSLKPPASHHCSVCKRCIARMDHHCPWVNTCVGYYNQKFFLQFLIYVALGSFHALVLIAIRSFKCLDKYCMLFRDVPTMIIAGVAGFLALLFGLFVIIMFVDQIQCICGNTSTIDKLKKDKQLGEEERS